MMIVNRMTQSKAKQAKKKIKNRVQNENINIKSYWKNYLCRHIEKSFGNK